ncbi:hypothetical protein [Glutamicibacter ardleyensis]|uniref:Phage tail protein n=1 Tax=Glutamicibacter ardleyensis TaxID=225894 RepID=A0ABQ2DEV8_9MICC|nr:hypothetical protein [Glutamicibacter ardleyensis]GGJ55655.1 hypothetical protein GCM10007173_13030 [Glutamicibacter ardleyensis]
MARTVNFDFTTGPNPATTGRIIMAGTQLTNDGPSITLPPTYVAYLVGGLASIPDVVPTPTDGSWKYQVKLEPDTGGAFWWIVSVSNLTTPVNFNALPVTESIAMPIDRTGTQLETWMNSVRAQANAANINATNALALIEEYHGGSASPTEFEAVDNWDSKKIVTYSDGTVRAIPYGDMPPGQPATPGAVAGSTLITVTWTLAAAARKIQLLRNGTVIYTGDSTRFVDRAVTDGVTYTYTLIAFDQWNQRSVLSGSATAAADSALNLTPQCIVTCWPNPLPMNGTGIIRVTGTDGEAQNLALTLGISVGTIKTTRDPSKWIYTA